MQAQTPAVLEGTVQDAQGTPMAYATVQLVGTSEGAATDGRGRFAFSTRQFGVQTLRASVIGYEPVERRVELVAGDTVAIDLVLKKSLVELDDVVVTASEYTTGETEDVTLSSLDVVTTPGAAADIFRAIRAFPGVATVDDGAALYVRGGDVSETVTLLDGARVENPYRYETPTSAVEGTIPPFLVKGTVFSSGGFSAQYGNALSAVLDMQTQDLPRETAYSLNVGLAAASAGIDLPINDRLGLRFSGNRSFTDLLFRINGQNDEFETTPRSTDLNLSLIYNYSSTGRIKVFNYFAADRLAVRVQEPGVTDFYRTQNDNWLHTITWQDVAGDWLLKAGASLNRYLADQQFGALDYQPTDQNAHVRFDAERDLNSRYRLKLGAEVHRTTDIEEGIVPETPDAFGPGQETFDLDVRFDAARVGGYAEFDVNPTRRIVGRVGVRADYHSLSEAVVLDPRVSLRYLLSEATDVRVAWGIYHQFAQPSTFGEVMGNPNLDPQRAQHFIAGLNHETDLWQLRAEGYYKPYRDLIIYDPETNYANRGEGMARGVDVFAKYGAFLQTRVYGHVAYSFLQSRRVQPRSLGDRTVYERGPTPYDITHNLTLVGKVQLYKGLSGGLTYRHATGQPHTPIVDALPLESGYLPVEGSLGAERLPAYRRVDLQLNYYMPFGGGSSAIFYLAVGNVLDRQNVLGYNYSDDYSTRTPQETDFSRFVYLGVSLNLVP